MLFNEVRRVGRQMNMPEEIIEHPFPGPGLAIRILGPITEERVTMLQEADSIFITALKEEGLYEKFGRQEPSCWIRAAALGLWEMKERTSLFWHCASLQ